MLICAHSVLLGSVISWSFSVYVEIRSEIPSKARILTFDWHRKNNDQFAEKKTEVEKTALNRKGFVWLYTVLFGNNEMKLIYFSTIEMAQCVHSFSHCIDAKMVFQKNWLKKLKSKGKWMNSFERNQNETKQHQAHSRTHTANFSAIKWKCRLLRIYRNRMSTSSDLARRGS